MEIDCPVVATDDLKHPSAAPFYFTVLTPSGRGAIATIAVDGPPAMASLNHLFRPASGRDLTSYESGHVVYGRFRSSDAVHEDVVVGVFGTCGAEIHCHGGPAAVTAICDALRRQGGAELPPDDWLCRQGNSRIRTDALLALVEARTERAAAILLDQYRGALLRDLETIDRLLAADDATSASENIKALLARAPLGLHLTQPWKVVFMGPPNVGKSSLMNALLGYERSIVWHLPGTTRDVLTATTVIDGWWIELSDVAGLRNSEHPLEAAGVARARQEITRADLAIVVSDSAASWDAELFGDLFERTRVSGVAGPPIIVHNKCDLAQSSGLRPEGIRTSAITGVGIDDLCRAISNALVPSAPPQDAAIPFRRSHVEQLERAAAAINSGPLATARKHLQAINTPKSA